MKNESNKSHKLKDKIREMKKTDKGKAILKLIRWAIFFFIIFIFIIISSAFSGLGSNNNNIPSQDKTPNISTPNTPASQYLKDNELKVLVEKLANNSFNYQINIEQDSSVYIFTGTKTLDNDTGYKESSEGIIKYIIDNSGTYKQTTTDKIPINDLYENLNPEYIIWSNLFPFIGNLEYYLIEENNNSYTYHMANLDTDFYLTITNNAITNIKIIKRKTETENIFKYDFTFNNASVNESTQETHFILTKDKFINDLKTITKYDYNYEISINNIQYLFNGHKDGLIDEGSKTSPEGTIKYYIDETGTYDNTSGITKPINNLYENINSEFFDLKYLASYLSDLPFLTNCTTCNAMENDTNNIEVSYTEQKELSSLDIISKDKTYKYHLEFKNIEVTNE